MQDCENSCGFGASTNGKGTASAVPHNRPLTYAPKGATATEALGQLWLRRIGAFIIPTLFRHEWKSCPSPVVAVPIGIDAPTDRLPPRRACPGLARKG